MPQNEFAAHRRAVARMPAAARAIVFGNSRHHAELAYLTNFVPKLEPAVALLSRDGRSPAARRRRRQHAGRGAPLTWIKTLPRWTWRRSRRWASSASTAIGRPPVLIGGGYMTSAVRQTSRMATRHGPAMRRRMLWTLMRRKSSFELAAIREACAHPATRRSTAIARRRARRRRRHRGDSRRRARRQRARRAGRAHAVQRSTAAARCSHFAALDQPDRRSVAGLRRRPAVQLLGRGICPLSNALSPAVEKADAAAAACASLRSSPACRCAHDVRKILMTVGDAALPPPSGDGRRAGQLDRDRAGRAAIHRCGPTSRPARSIRCEPASPTARDSTPSSRP